MRPLVVGGRGGAAVYIRPDMDGLGPEIAQRARRDDLLRETIVYLTCLHELGHALGLAHTAAFDDIMYFFGYGGDIVEFFGRYRRQLRSRGDIARVAGLSDADIKRLRALYPGRGSETPRPGAGLEARPGSYGEKTHDTRNLHSRRLFVARPNYRPAVLLPSTTLNPEVRSAMRTVCRASCLAFLLSVSSSPVWAQPTFVNGILIPGNALDATGEPGANAGRFGHFSDLYYDPIAMSGGRCRTAARAAGCSTTRHACSASTSTSIRSPGASRTSGQGDDPLPRSLRVPAGADGARRRRTRRSTG